MKKRSAFSLLEISVVLMVIAVLTAGVTQGVGLINSARLANARSITSKSAVPNIPGLVAWYETSLKESLKNGENVDGTQITTWHDVSPNSIAAKKNKLTKTAGNDALYRLAGINKVPSILFNGSGKVTISAFYQGDVTQATVFLVFQPNFSPSSTQVIPFDSYNGQNRFSIGIKNNAVRLDNGTGADTGTGSNPASFSSGSAYAVAAYINGSSSGAYVNNATTLAGAANIDSGSNSLNGVSIGADKNGSSGFTGFISEIIIYNRPLKLQERKDVMSYLSKKYKISVSGI